MPTKAQKNQAVAELQNVLDQAQLAIVADYRGLSVKELTDLRRRVQAAGGNLHIAKNTLIKIAMKDKEQWQGLNTMLEGPTALVIGNDDFIGATKALTDFAKEKRAVKVEIRGGVLHGEALDTKRVEALGNLPSRETLLAMVAQLLMSPITGIARGINALAQKREEAGGAPAAAAEAPAAEAPAAEAPAPEAPAAEAPAAEAPAPEAPASEEPNA